MCLCCDPNNGTFFDYILNQHIRFINTRSEEDLKYLKSWRASRQRAITRLGLKINDGLGHPYC